MPSRYDPLEGPTKTSQTLTWFDAPKAVAMATAYDGRSFGTQDGIYEVSVEEVGRAPRNADGSVDIIGYLHDRMEF
jgi:hypothetical protein